MPNISLRGVDKEIADRLKAEAKRQRVSVNTLILGLLKHGMNAGTRTRRRKVHHDLDALAGTWTAKEARAFMKSLSDFEHIDEEVWR